MESAPSRVQTPHAIDVEVVLELGGDRVRVGRDPVDVRVAEHGPAHRPCRVEVLRLFHRAARSDRGFDDWSILAAPLSGTYGWRHTSTGNDTFTSE